MYSLSQRIPFLGDEADRDRDLVQAYAEALGRDDSLAPRDALAAALDAFLADGDAFRAAHADLVGAEAAADGSTPRPPAVDVASLMTRAERHAANSPVASRRGVGRVEAGGAAALGPDDDSEIDDDDDEEDDDGSAGDFDPYLFMKHLPPKSAAARDGWDAAHPRLQPRSRSASAAKPVTLVLDLDETLVHSQMEPRADADFVFDVQLCGVTSTVYAKSRPRLESFLDYAAARFEVVVFTASHQAYAETLLDKIDPTKKRIAHRLFRDACATVDGLYLKDLDVLGRDLAKVAMVDNTPYVFGFQPDNAVPIESWYDDPDDTELDALKLLLDRLEKAADVRPILIDAFKMQATIDAADAGDGK